MSQDGSESTEELSWEAELLEAFNDDRSDALDELCQRAHDELEKILKDDFQEVDRKRRKIDPLFECVAVR
jgi:hypothetical protein